MPQRFVVLARAPETTLGQLRIGDTWVARDSIEAGSKVSWAYRKTSEVGREALYVVIYPIGPDSGEQNPISIGYPVTPVLLAVVDEP